MGANDQEEGMEREDRNRSNRRKWLVNLVLLAASFSIALLVGEVLLRWVFIPPVPTFPHRIYHHTRPTNALCRWVSAQDEFDTRVRFNSLALRGSEPDLSKKHLWLFLGDSLIEGLQVPEESTVTKFLESELGEGYSVLNAGVGGYSPILMALRLPEILEQIAPKQPEKILIGLFPNDLEEEYLYRSIAYKDSKGKIVAVTPGVLRGPVGRLRTALFRHSSIVQVLQKSFFSGKKRQESEPDLNPYHPSEKILYPFRTRWTEAEKKVWSQLFRSIGDIQRLCRSRNIELVLVIVPPGHQIGPDVWKTGKQEMGFPPDYWVESTSFQDEILLRADRIGVTAIDLLPDFKEHDSPRDLYFDFDGHWTAEGNRFAARTLYTHLAEASTDAIPQDR